jgi:hypothetical protein
VVSSIDRAVRSAGAASTAAAGYQQTAGRQKHGPPGSSRNHLFIPFVKEQDERQISGQTIFSMKSTT